MSAPTVDELLRAALTQADDDTLLQAIAGELQILESRQETCVFVLQPLAAFQLVGALQLVLRHSELPEACRTTIDEIVRAVAAWFAPAPALSELISRGNDPAEDIPASPLVVIP